MSEPTFHLEQQFSMILDLDRMELEDALAAARSFIIARRGRGEKVMLTAIQLLRAEITLASERPANEKLDIQLGQL